MATSNASRGAKDGIGNVVKYMECLRNHGVKSMSYIFDGCGEYEPSGTEGTPKSPFCAVCGCHRNFHRRLEVQLPSHRKSLNTNNNGGSDTVPDATQPQLTAALMQQIQPQVMDQVQAATPQAIEGQSEKISDEEIEMNKTVTKKMRTKVSPERKEKLEAFADKIGWTIRNCDEKDIKKFCSAVGMTKLSLRNWINNNRKKSLAKSSKVAQDSHLIIPKSKIVCENEKRLKQKFISSDA